MERIEIERDLEINVSIWRINPTNTKIEKFSLFRSLPQSKLLFTKDDFNSQSCSSATDVCSLVGRRGL